MEAILGGSVDHLLKDTYIVFYTPPLRNWITSIRFNMPKFSTHFHCTEGIFFPWEIRLVTNLHKNQDLCHIVTFIMMPYNSESSEAVWFAGIFIVFSAMILWIFLLASFRNFWNWLFLGAVVSESYMKIASACETRCNMCKKTQPYEHSTNIQ